MQKRIFMRSLTLAVLALAGASVGAQQAYPNKPIRLVIPFAAGGGVDAVGRAVAQKLSERIGQPVIVDNRAGAGGSIATENVARSAPDGYSLLLTTHGHTIQPSTQKVPWDPVKDFEPVIQVLNYALLIETNPAVPASNLKEFIAYAKANPGKLNYGSSGPGGPIHFAMEMFKSQAGIDIVHVPFKGNGPMTVALLANEVQVSMDALTVGLPHIKAGKLRALAVSGPRRSPLLPDVPTVSEAAIPGFDHRGWHGILAPAGTPKTIVSYLNGEVKKVLESQDVKDKIQGFGYDPTTSTADEFAELIRRDFTKNAKVIKDANIRGE